MTLLERINRISPKHCRLLARKDHGRRPMSNADIAKAGGLARSTVAKVSNLMKWDRLPLETIYRFSLGCGVDLLRLSSRRDKRLLASGRLSFMERSAPTQRRMYGRLLKDLRGGLQNVCAGPACSQDRVDAESRQQASPSFL